MHPPVTGRSPGRRVAEAERDAVEQAQHRVAVVPAATEFLLNFNEDEFNTQVRARDYYSFVTLLMLAMGIGFQIPVGVLAACKLGVTSAEKLRRSRRYAIVVMTLCCLPSTSLQRSDASCAGVKRN